MSILETVKSTVDKTIIVWNIISPPGFCGLEHVVWPTYHATPKILPLQATKRLDAGLPYFTSASPISSRDTCKTWTALGYLNDEYTVSIHAYPILS